MKPTRSIKACSFTAIALLAATVAVPASAQPGINLGISGGVTASLGLSSLGAVGSIGSAPSLGSVGSSTSLSSNFAGNASLVAPTGADAVQQTISEMTAELSANGSAPSLPGLGDTPSSASLSGSVNSAVNGTLSGLEGLETGSAPSASIVSEVSGELAATVNQAGEQAPNETTDSTNEDASNETTDEQASTGDEEPSVESAEADEAPTEEHFAEFSGSANSNATVSMY